MSSTLYTISIDLAPLASVLTEANNAVALRVSMTVAATAARIQERWLEAVMRAPGLWMGEKDAYAQSIQCRSISGFEAEVWSDYKHAREIETGRPARDLKKMLDTSMRVRVSAKGSRYLYIPMRHNTPGNSALGSAMPQSVYDIVRTMPQSRITGTAARIGGKDVYDTKTKEKYLVPQNEYKWGGKLAAGMVPKLKDGHKADPYAGMVRFENATGGSQYLTFRVMSENSPADSWIVPEKPGLFLVQGIVADIEPLFRLGIQESFRRGLAAG